MEQLLYHLDVDHDDKRTLPPRSAVQPILFLESFAHVRGNPLLPDKDYKVSPMGPCNS